MRRIAFVAMILALAATGGGAQEVKTLGTFGKWSAFSYDEGGKQVCYAASIPIKSEGAYKSRGDVQALITHRPAEQAIDVVNIVAGYYYKPDTDANVAVGSRRFDLFTVEGRAWARDAKTDKDLVQAFITANSMVVKGVSSRGTPTTDTFSLQGFTAAYKAIGEACGLKAG
ncbi:MAG: hypothetical protein FJX59_03395 [Alphaproteobacteria bacterium]|nr:hypothetical protein [Alphaproteobacteria bacterium]